MCKVLILPQLAGIAGKLAFFYQLHCQCLIAACPHCRFRTIKSA